MSEEYYTPYVDGTTQFKADHMNYPLEELNTQIVANVAAIDAVEEDINQSGLSSGAGKFVMVNQGGTAFVFKDIICNGGEVVVCNGEMVIN